MMEGVSLIVAIELDLPVIATVFHVVSDPLLLFW